MFRSELLCLAALSTLGALGCAAAGSTDDSPIGPTPVADGSTEADANQGTDGSNLIDGNASCTPKKCTDMGATCGTIEDGCGKLVDCGQCPAGQTCGAEKPNTCGTGCAPRSCSQLGASCGQQGDGCGELIECGSCETPLTCGGAGVHNTCGEPGGVDGGACKPKTCDDLKADCGAVADGCGGIVQCGTCQAPGQVCGAKLPNVCGGATNTCKAKTCDDLGANCGAVGDGCGGIIASCGTCSQPGEVCGGGGKANVCGSTLSCTPKTCDELGTNCGWVGDGCGDVVYCGKCAAGESCGVVTPSVCAPLPSCTPKTCGDLGATCGAIPDGCGGIVADCGSCAAPQACNGDPNKPYQCGCTGVCAQVPTCQGGTTTTLTGIVKDPAGNTPLNRVLVYVPNNPSDPALQSFPSGLTCDQCGANAAGNPLVSTFTKTDGTFSLSGVPVGSGVTVVIQVGRWRRQFKVDITKACQSNVATGTGQGGTTIQGGVLTMPKNKAQGNIPLTSIVTALGDNIECVFLKMGIDQSEFTNPGDGGRIELYNTAGRGPMDIALGGAFIDYSTPDSHDLVNKLQNYDQVVLPCPGTASVTGEPLLTQYTKLVDYANAGGRIFTTHYSYIYLQKGGGANPFYGTALWSNDHSKSLSVTATVDTDPAVNPKGAEFSSWLWGIGALTTQNPPTMTVTEARYDVSSVVSPTQQWMRYTPSGQSSPVPMHFTFNAPVGAPGSSQCGRVVFSDFHVVQSPSSATFFPDECSTAPMTAQEKVLEFMLFDLASCVQPYTAGCTPTTCAQQGIECGPSTDGCGNAIQCGSCSPGTTCGGGGKPGKCGTTSCTPKTCAGLGVECGATGDGCGNVLQCGTCPGTLKCGGAGIPGKCGSATCIPSTCDQLGVECGSTGDGCGEVIDCGGCSGQNTCGGGGVPGECGTASCAPKSCTALGVECGPVGDGCGNVLQCGDCTKPETCGGAGTPGQCGIVTCTPEPCGSRCGKQGDGCGNVIDCPPCASPCVPATCDSLGAKCGKVGDGCGGVIDCGTCPDGSSCGGGGKPFECGGVR